jgi:hypothetical protein
MSEKTPIQKLVEEWLSLDKKRNLRDETYSWLRLTRKPMTSTPTQNDGKIVCPEKQEAAAEA